MNYSYPFRSELFTNNHKDYQVDGADHWRRGSFRRAKFKPLGVGCVVRITELDKEDIELIENEQTIDKLVSHPNVISIMTSFMVGQSLWTVFPRSPFPSLQELSKPFGLNEKLIALVLADMLKAVDYLHSSNIIHRAIVASHILMFGTFETNIKFVLTGLKFSLKMLAQPNKQAYDYPKGAHRVLHSIAPEVLEQNTDAYNYKADIYSLGILCCELANGMIPFDNMDSVEILFSKIMGDIPKPIDRDHEEMIIFRDHSNKMETTLKRRYLTYSKRKFTRLFHEFCSICLHIEPTRRPSANELLEHGWIVGTLLRFDRKDKMALLKLQTDKHM